MSMAIETTSLYVASENVSADKASSADNKNANVPLTVSNLQNQYMEWMNESILSIMQIFLEISLRCASQVGARAIDEEINISKAYIDQTSTALNEKFDGLEGTKDANLGISAGKIGCSVLAVSGLFILPKFFEKSTGEMISKIISHNSIGEAIPELVGNPYRVKGSQAMEMADNRSVMNRVVQACSDRLEQLKGQMFGTIPKMCTTFEDIIYKLSSVYKVSI